MSMPTLRDQIERTQGNNLNAIRLALALAVIVSHSFPLSLGVGGESRGEPMATWTNQQESFGSLAVNLFFLISGMLITASWLHSKSMQDFLMRRFLRIYPAYIVAMGFAGALIWMLCPEFRTEAGFGVVWLVNFGKDCLLLHSGSLCWNGIFAGNPYPNAANGSLWTIPVEFLCYLLVAWIGLFCFFKHRKLILAATLLSYLVLARYLLVGHDVTNFPCRFLTYFLLGMSFWLWRDKIPFTKWLAVGCIVSLLIASQFKPWFALLFPVLGGYGVLYLGYGAGFPWMGWTRKTDLSYGTYLYAFPVQQVVAMHEIFRDPWINLAVATPAVLFCAWLSWVVVEKRFLAMKRIVRTDYDPGAKAFVTRSE